MPIDNNKFNLQMNNRFESGVGGTAPTKPTQEPTTPTTPTNPTNPPSDGGSSGSSSSTTTTPITRPTYNNSYEQDYLNYINQMRDNNQTYLDQLKQQLEESSYLDLMRSNIALSNARETASAYANNYMSAMGYGTQGYGSSAYTQNQNAYLNALSNNRATYSDNNAEIQQAYTQSMLENQQNYDNNYLNYLNSMSEREYNEYLSELNQYYTQQNQQAQWDREDQQNQQLQDMTADDTWLTTIQSMLGNFATQEEGKNYLVSQGLMDESGNWSSELTQNQIRELNAIYGALGTLSSTTDGFDLTNNQLFPTSTNGTIDGYYNKDGEYQRYGNMGRTFEQEYNVLAGIFSRRGLEDMQNKVVKMTNGNGDYIYVMYDSTGALRILNEPQFTGAEIAYEIYYDTKTNTVKTNAD